MVLLRAQQTQAAAYATMARTMALRAELAEVISQGREQVAAGQARRQQQDPVQANPASAK